MNSNISHFFYLLLSCFLISNEAHDRPSSFDEHLDDEKASCPGSAPTNNYYYATDDIHWTRMRGPPGKSGPSGAPGLKGQKGLKGEMGRTGRCTCDLHEITSTFDDLLVKMEELQNNPEMELRFQEWNTRLNSNQKAQEDEVIQLENRIHGIQLKDQELSLKIMKMDERIKELTNEYTVRSQLLEVMDAKLANITKEFDEKVDKLADKIWNPPRTCHSMGNQIASGSYYIRPSSSVQPFLVYCDFQQEPVQTMIGHDSEHEVQVDGYESHYSYKRVIHYDATMAQMVALINASANCKQYIKYRCKGSILHGYGYAAWIDRAGTNRTTWGGAETTDYCACGETNTCIDSRFKCNCDANDGNQIAFDDGYLSDKELLPVTQLWFGDTGGESEMGWHTLGKLICMN